MPRRSRSVSLSTPKFLPYEAQHVLLNTVQRLLEESCFDFAKTWFSSDHRVREWTSPAQVEISKWRDLLGTARIPYDALDGNVQTPLRVLLQEATHIRNNAVHRSQVPADDILKMLTSSIQLARMLRDETRRTKIEDIRGRLIYELHARDNNRVRAAVGYRKARDDIDRRKEPVFRKLDELSDEEDHAISVFEKDSAVYDKMLQNSVVKFINQVIHTGEEVARIAPAADSAPKSLPIVKNSNAVTGGKPEKCQRRDDDDIQFISKSDFEVATSSSGKPPKEPAQDAGPGSKDKEVFFKQDHTEDVLSSIRPTPSAANFVGIQSTPGCRNRKNSSCGGAGSSIKSISKGATPQTLNVVNSAMELDMDSPSRQLELEANMASSIRELSIDEYDILGNLDAELDNQLVRTMDAARVSVNSVLDQMNSDIKPNVEEPVPDIKASGDSNGQDNPQPNRSWTEPCVLGRRVQSSELKMTDRSSAPSPDAEMSGADPSNAASENTATADSAATIGLPVVEFGKPWKPTAIESASVTRAVSSQGGILRTGAGSQVTELGRRSVSVTRVEKSQESILQAMAELPAKPSVPIFEDGKSKQVGLSTMHLGRKRKAASPLSQRTPASCNSMISRPNTLSVFGDPSFPTGVELNGSQIQSIASVRGFSMITSFGDVARFAKDVGFNPKSSTVTGVGQMNDFQMSKPQETPDTDVYTSRQAATWERRRILVGCLSFTPSKEEVERLFLGYSVTRIDFPEMWIMETKNKPSGCVFVDLATAAQAKLAIQKLCGSDPKIRNCKVSILLATDPWKGANVPRKILSKLAKNMRRTARLSGPVLSGAVETKRKSEPIGKRTRSYYAAAREKAVADDQSSKRQKLMTDASKETTGLGGN